MSGSSVSYTASRSQLIGATVLFVGELITVLEWLALEPPGVRKIGGRWRCEYEKQSLVGFMWYGFVLHLITLAVILKDRNFKFHYGEGLRILTVCVIAAMLDIIWVSVYLSVPGAEEVVIPVTMTIMSTMILAVMFVPNIIILIKQISSVDRDSETNKDGPQF